ncbi:hypothetical protein JCM14469_41310 [Desulfatiferula olefinivorans]
MKSTHVAPVATLIRDLTARGVDRMSLLLRHSARHYDDDIRMEPFMCLTGKGRDMALALGAQLPYHVSVEFFSSYIGRCIETAYLIDKGFVRQAGGLTCDNRVVESLAPFYVNDIKKTVNLVMEQDVFTFIRNWMDGVIGESILMNAREAARQMLRVLVGGLREIDKNTLQVSVTHDWNMYLIKEYVLGLSHEQCGKVDYLEGVVLFPDGDTVYAVNHQTGPVALSMEL